MAWPPHIPPFTKTGESFKVELSTDVHNAVLRLKDLGMFKGTDLRIREFHRWYMVQGMSFISCLGDVYGDVTQLPLN